VKNLTARPLHPNENAWHINAVFAPEEVLEMTQRIPLSIMKPLAGIVTSLAVVFMLSSCGGSSSPTEPEAATNPVGGAVGGSSSNTGTGGGTGDGGGSGSGGGSGTSSGTLAIQMIDAPTAEICEIWVYIRDIRVKPDEESPILLGTGIGLYELLALQEGPAAPLGEWVVDGGLYQFIEILLDEDQSYVVERDQDDPGDDDAPNCLTTTPSDLQIPSEKFKVNGGPFTVTTETTVTIDFDAKRSLKRKGSTNNPKGWMLNPKVSIVDVDAD
jgi:hypothetical protein